VHRGMAVLLACLVAAVVVGSVSATGPVLNGRIAYVSDVNGVSELFSIRPDGTDVQRLTWTFAGENSPTWSPDGSQIAYRSDGGIWLTNADGSDQRQLTDGSEPKWSPDGTQIAFARVDDFNAAYNVWVISVDGTGLRRVSTAFATEPAWSPDGTRLAYTGLDGISVVGVDGTNPRTIVGPAGLVGSPAWSPDGHQIAFSRHPATGQLSELYVVNTDGSGERQVTHGALDGLPSWSPDGTQLVFQRIQPSDFSFRLYVVDSDGGGERLLSAGRSPAWGTSQVSPQVSPPDAPMIEIASPASSPGYVQGETVHAFYRCDSAVSFIVSCAGDVPFGEAIDTSAGTHTFTVRATDADGRTSGSSVTYDVVDIFPPQIDLRTPTDGARYALNSVVHVDYSCSDPAGSGIEFCLGDRAAGAPLDTATLGSHTFTVNAVDRAFHITTRRVAYTVVASPAISISSPADGARYGLNAPVLADYACKDLIGAGINTCLGDRPAGTPIDTSSPGPHTFKVTALDSSSNLSTTTVTYTVVAPPSVFITSPVADASYVLGASLATDYSCSSHDASVLTCSGGVPVGGLLDTSIVGRKTFTVRATDAIGQTTSRTSSYRVVYPFSGFDSPVSTNGVLDGAKAGQGIPLKFSLGGDRGLGIVAGLSWQQVSCTDGTTTGQPVPGSGKLSYSASSGRYLDVVTTDPSWKGSCRTLIVQLADTTLKLVLVRFAH
jgi:dipeptidyl aminopeptidase/acylaminoacyl peptidase